MSHASQIHLQALIKSFNLTIYLRRVRSAEMKASSNCFHQFLPKGTCEQGISVWYYDLRHSMQLMNNLHRKMSYPVNQKRMSKRNKVHWLVSLFSDLSSYSIESIDIWVQAWDGTGNGCKSPGIATFSSLQRWQISHCCIHWITCFFMSTQ